MVLVGEFGQARMRNMKRQFIQLLNHNIVANIPLVSVARIVCFVASGAVLMFGIWNLVRFDLPAVGTLFGVLLSSFTSVIFVALGLFLPKVARMETGPSE